MKYTSIPDIPCPEKDSFGIHPYAQGLIRFIKGTKTPITIALQGEWGSGKTSLMNTLQDELCGPDGQFLPVWINTWEYALMQDTSSTLIQIISKMVQQTASDNNKRKALFEKVKRISTVAAKTAIGITGGDGSAIDEFFSTKNSSVGELRDELQKTVKEKVEEDGKRGFIFFIDDLDRINPPTAVELLELLKNIFTLEYCVFVLAIDYDVVVKGLKPKFGELTDTNEREFRSFFDKIIQVPFTMPVSNYKIDSFLQQSLLEIGWLNTSQAQTTPLIGRISKTAQLTVSNNPRSLKRLLNNLSLIHCINASISDDNEKINISSNLDVYLNFTLVAIQIAYPKIYSILKKHPDFTTWNEEIAVQLNLKALDDDEKQRLSKNSHFDELWEQILYRICESDYYLRSKAINISTLFDEIRTAILEFKDEGNPIKDIRSAMEDALSLSAVTNLEAFDDNPVDIHTSSFLKTVRDLLIKELKRTMPKIRETIEPASARVQTNAPVWLIPGVHFNLHADNYHSYKGKILLSIRLDASIDCDTLQYDDIKAFYNAIGHSEELHRIEQEYEKTVQKYSQERMSCFNSRPLLNVVYPGANSHVVAMEFWAMFPDVQQFYKPDVVAHLTNMVRVMYDTRQKLRDAAKIS